MVWGWKRYDDDRRWKDEHIQPCARGDSIPRPHGPRSLRCYCFSDLGHGTELLFFPFNNLSASLSYLCLRVCANLVYHFYVSELMSAILRTCSSFFAPHSHIYSCIYIRTHASALSCSHRHVQSHTLSYTCRSYSHTHTHVHTLTYTRSPLTHSQSSWHTRSLSHSHITLTFTLTLTLISQTLSLYILYCFLPSWKCETLIIRDIQIIILRWRSRWPDYMSKNIKITLFRSSGEKVPRNNPLTFIFPWGVNWICLNNI